MKNFKTCAIIGATPETLAFGYDEEHYDAIVLKKKLAESILALISQGVVKFISSISEGVEMWGAEVCAAIRKSGSPLALELVPTNEEQANRWHPSVRERYFTLLEECSDVVYAKLSDEEKLDRTLHEMAERAFCDEYILSNSDMIVAAGELDMRAGSIIQAANDRGIPVIRI